MAIARAIDVRSADLDIDVVPRARVQPAIVIRFAQLVRPGGLGGNVVRGEGAGVSTEQTGDPFVSQPLMT
jgi:hypothetical protein